MQRNLGALRFTKWPELTITFRCCKAWTTRSGSAKYCERRSRLLVIQICSVLSAIYGQFAYIANGAQLVLNRVNVIAQLAISVTLPVNGDEQGHRVPKVPIDDRPADSIGQLGGAGLVHLVPYLGPHKIGVFHVLFSNT